MRVVRRMFGTVRVRITLLATVVATVVLVAASLGLLAVLDSQLTQQSDATLRARAVELAEVAVAGGLPSVPATTSEEGLVQVVDAEGRVLAASSNIAGAAPIADPVAEIGTGVPRVVTLDAPDDNEIERYRVWSVARAVPSGVVTVFVGTSLESVDEATRTLRRLLLIGIPLLLLVLAAGTWQVVGRALGDVERVRREVDEIGEDDLTLRLEEGPPDEVGRLITTLNAMLARLEDGQRRQRDFVADASHELQSPVTALRTQLEVASAHPAGVDWRRLVDDLIEDTGRMQTLLADLLLLARGGAGAPDRTPLDLRDLVREVAARGVGAEGILAAHLEDPVPVLGDEAQLARVVDNLIDNALMHARSSVVVRAGRDGDSGWVRVTDDGPGVPMAERERIFDRFYRAEQARSPGAHGTGLGLAIARTIARAHGGDITLSDDAAPGACFELRLPLTPE